MPDSMVTFFSALYNIPKHKLFRSKAKEFSDMINVGEEYESGFDKEHDENDGTDYRNSPVQEEPVEKNSMIHGSVTFRVLVYTAYSKLCTII